MDDLKNKFAIIRGMIEMMNSMFGFNQCEYGKGMVHGIISTLRALGLQDEFEAYLQEVKQPKAEEK